MAGVLAAQLACAAPARACGVCVEDKMAAVYDHAVVAQALARKHQVAFFHIDGMILPGDATKRWLESVAASTASVDAGSVRVSVETTSMSVAFDPKRASLMAVQTALDRKLAARKLSLMPLRVIEGPGQLKAAAGL
jgi:hypothetical protein